MRSSATPTGITITRKEKQDSFSIPTSPKTDTGSKIPSQKENAKHSPQPANSTATFPVDPQGPWGFLDAVNEPFSKTEITRSTLDGIGARPQWFDKASLF